MLSVLSYDLGCYRKKQIEDVRRSLSSSEPNLKPWKPSKGSNQSQVRPDFFLRTTKSAVNLKETLKAFFLHSSSIAKPDQLKDLLPKHRYFIAEATLRWQDWPKKIFQLEKALACLKHANETGNDKFHHPFELAIGALLFHAEDALVIDEAKEKITASLENIEGSLVHDLWIKNRVLVGFAPFPNIFVTLYNVDKRLKGL